MVIKKNTLSYGHREYLAGSCEGKGGPSPVGVLSGKGKCPAMMGCGIFGIICRYQGEKTEIISQSSHNFTLHLTSALQWIMR